MKPLLLSAIVLSLCLVVSCGGNPEPVAVAEPTVTPTSTLPPPTETPTPTETSTVTPTITPTSTPTATSTPTGTPTPLPTATPTPAPPTSTPTPAPPTATPTPEPTPTLTTEEENLALAEQISPGYAERYAKLKEWRDSVYIEPGFPIDVTIDMGDENFSVLERVALVNSGLLVGFDSRFCKNLLVLGQDKQDRGWVCANSPSARAIAFGEKSVSNAESFHRISLADPEFQKDYFALRFIYETWMLQYRTSTGDNDFYSCESKAYAVSRDAAHELARIREQEGRMDLRDALNGLAAEAQTRIDKGEFLKSWGDF